MASLYTHFNVLRQNQFAFIEFYPNLKMLNLISFSEVDENKENNHASYFLLRRL